MLASMLIGCISNYTDYANVVHETEWAFRKNKHLKSVEPMDVDVSKWTHLILLFN